LVCVSIPIMESRLIGKPGSLGPSRPRSVTGVDGDGTDVSLRDLEIGDEVPWALDREATRAHEQEGLGAPRPNELPPAEVNGQGDNCNRRDDQPGSNQRRYPAVGRFHQDGRGQRQTVSRREDGVLDLTAAGLTVDS
jgi:hypothetical protein